MAVFKYTQSLLALTEPSDVAQEGARQVLLEESYQREELVFKVWFDLTQAGGETSPTTRAVLQTSHDGEHWADLVESSELSGEGQRSEWQDVADVGPYVRAVTVLEGAVLPQHTAVVLLMSHSPFRLKPVS